MIPFRAALAITAVGFSQVAAQTQPARPDSAVVVNPTSAAQAVSLGVKLLGIYDSKTGSWIDHATVRDTLGNEVTSTRNGIAPLNALSPLVGVYLVEVRKEGYAPRRLRIPADSGSEFMIGLEPNPLGDVARLPAVVTTDRAALQRDPGLSDGFFHRCELGATCIGRKDLDLRPSEKLAEMLGTKKGIHRDCSSPYGAGSAKGARDIRNNAADYYPGCTIMMLAPTTTGGSPYCTPTYYLNGIEWQPQHGGGGSAQNQLDDVVNPTTISGIEVYLTEDVKPARYEKPPVNGMRCGSVVIWTRKV